jgi:hypothetical protein
MQFLRGLRQIPKSGNGLKNAKRIQRRK